jgi:hypothetical protein
VGDGVAVAIAAGSTGVAVEVVVGSGGTVSATSGRVAVRAGATDNVPGTICDGTVGGGLLQAVNRTVSVSSKRTTPRLFI